MLIDYVFGVIFSICNIAVMSYFLNDLISRGVDDIIGKIFLVSFVIILIYSIFSATVLGYMVITLI